MTAYNAPESVTGTITDGALIWDGADWVNQLVTRDNVGATLASQIPVSGAGSPAGVVTATPGTLYLNTSGGANTTLWVKESGSGTGGWVAK